MSRLSVRQVGTVDSTQLCQPTQFTPPTLDESGDWASPGDLETMARVLGLQAAYLGHIAREREYRRGEDQDAAHSFRRAAADVFKQLPEWAQFRTQS